MKRRRERFRCVLSPETRAMSLWDMQMMMALLFLSLVTPYEVGFLPMAFSFFETLFLINRFLDLFFTDFVPSPRAGFVSSA